mgnify:CR=1 FL=1
MKKIKFKNINEILYEETLPNKLKVIYYNTKKTKNFYISISTLYGAGVTKYKKNGKLINIIPGTAHFLEHRIMDFTKNKRAMKLISDLGSMPNAYTMHDITNYNIFGGTDLNKNLMLLLDRVFNPNIKEKDVISEKGIISEEIDMENDNLNTVMLYKAMNNTFTNDKSMCIPVLGEKSDIDKITSDYLVEIYKDFYRYDKMHIVICGNFNIDEISQYIHNYFKNKFDNNDKIKIIYDKESDKVKIDYLEINRDVVKDKTGIVFKIPLNDFKKIKNTDLNRYLNILFTCMYGNTSFVKTNLEKLGITGFNFLTKRINNYFVIILSGSGESKKFIDFIIKSTKNIKISKLDFESKIKVMISGLILDFEDIVNIESFITDQIKLNGKIIKNAKNELLSLDYKIFKNIYKNLNFNNKSILRITNSN